MDLAMVEKPKLSPICVGILRTCYRGDTFGVVYVDAPDGCGSALANVLHRFINTPCVAPNAFPTVGLHGTYEKNTTQAAEVSFWAIDATLVPRGAGAITSTGRAPGDRVCVAVRGNRAVVDENILKLAPSKTI